MLDRVSIYAGYDPREAIGLHVFTQSLFDTSRGVGFTPLCGETDGTNAFTLERFRIPELGNWAHWSIFLDGSDMLLRADIRDLCKLRDGKYAVQVVKHDYKTKHHRKYVGTEIEADNHDYPRKNWSSVIIWNGSHKAHFRNRDKVQDALERKDGKYLHRFGWLEDDEIGELPIEWNWLADEYGENQNAKLLHWTAGIPGFTHYAGAPHADEWKAALRRAQRGL